MKNPNLKEKGAYWDIRVVAVVIILAMSSTITISSRSTIGILAGLLFSYFCYSKNTKRRSIVSDGEGSSPLPPDKVEALIQEDCDPSIVKGSERCIVWHKQSGIKTSTCVVFLHGWSACRQECRPVPERLAKALKANLYCGRLPGHGGSGTKLLEEAIPSQLQEEARLAWRVGKSLGDRVVLVGMSTGAALLTWLISTVVPDIEREEIIRAFILISPAYALGHPAYPILKSVFYGLRRFPREWLLELVLGGKSKSSPALNEEHEKYTTLTYPTAALLHLLDVLEDCNMAYDPSKVTMPTLLVGNPKDNVVNIPLAIDIWTKFQATTKQILCLEAAEHPHCIASEILSPSSVEQISKNIITFVESSD